MTIIRIIGPWFVIPIIPIYTFVRLIIRNRRIRFFGCLAAFLILLVWAGQPIFLSFFSITYVLNLGTLESFVLVMGLILLDIVIQFRGLNESEKPRLSLSKN